MALTSISPNSIESNDEPTSHGSTINFLLLEERSNPLFLDGNYIEKWDIEPEYGYIETNPQNACLSIFEIDFPNVHTAI